MGWGFCTALQILLLSQKSVPARIFNNHEFIRSSSEKATETLEYMGGFSGQNLLNQ
jgi:hypothetical protein